MLMDPHLSQQHAGVQHAVWRPHEQAIRPKARIKQTSAKKFVVDGGETYLTLLKATTSYF